MRRPPAQEQAWPALQSGQQRVGGRPDRIGQDICGVSRRDRPARARRDWQGPLPDETRIVYVSPLKALSNDIQRNLEAPLKGIREELAALEPARCGDSRDGAHRRHVAGRAGGHAAQAAAHRRDHARVAVHPAGLDVRARHARDLPHRDRR